MRLSKYMPNTLKDFNIFWLYDIAESHRFVTGEYKVGAETNHNSYARNCHTYHMFHKQHFNVRYIAYKYCIYTYMM